MLVLLKILVVLLLFYYLGRLLLGITFKTLVDKSGHFSSDPLGKRQSFKKEVVMIGEMVACSNCGIYVAKSNTVEQEGKLYCSQACITI